MDIRVVSSLTQEDEERVAPSILAALCELLDRLPIAYAIRIEGTGRRVFEHTSTTPNPLRREARSLRSRPSSSGSP
jgi:hypothetical protein